MESLSEETWDVVISGTGLQQSLLALSLSRSDKKILHVDRHTYYGGEDAGFNLQDAVAWVKDLEEVGSEIFSEPSIQQTEQSTEGTAPRLASPRSYTVSLRPQIVYARSAFLPTLVSSQIHSQLEFLAVGSWWVLRENELHKIPSTREDVFNDDTLSMRDKRSLMKFLRFVLQEESEPSEKSADTSGLTLQQTLQKYKIPMSLQSPILALALSPRSAQETDSDEAVARIRRHLQSVGYFGPGFGAVIAKYGGNAEISQVACRAQAVGGGVYLLGHGIQSVDTAAMGDSADGEVSLTRLTLSDGTAIKAKQVVGGVDDLPANKATVAIAEGESQTTLQSISVVAHGLKTLFPPTAESGPVPAAAIVLVEQSANPTRSPIYLQIHSEDTGECPSGQCIIYGSTIQQAETPPHILHDAVSEFLRSVTSDESTAAAQILWHLSYKSHAPTRGQQHGAHTTITTFPARPFEIGVEDNILEAVRKVWEIIVPDSLPEAFLRFEERGQEDMEDV